VIANSATYAEIISVLGPCAAPQVNRGATVTPCQGGGLRVIQAGPTLQSITIAVERAAQ
jgi:hypothetical protein